MLLLSFSIGLFLIAVRDTHRERPFGGAVLMPQRVLFMVYINFRKSQIAGCAGKSLDHWRTLPA